MIDSFDYDTECIQITTNGVYAGTVFYREKHKFNINSDARLLIRKNNNLDYRYLTILVKNILAEQNFNWENKPTIGKISDLELAIPVDGGVFDLETQQHVVEQHNIVAELEKNKGI